MPLADPLTGRPPASAPLHNASARALQAGLGSEQGQAAVNDIPNFATGGVTIFLPEID